MSFLLHPVHVVVTLLTEWVRHEQEKVIEFLRTETEVLLEQLGDKRILLSDDDRRLLAVKGMALEKEDLENVCVIVQPDTLRRWHRELVERNRFKNPQRKTGRPGTDQEIACGQNIETPRKLFNNLGLATMPIANVGRRSCRHGRKIEAV